MNVMGTGIINTIFIAKLGVNGTKYLVNNQNVKYQTMISFIVQTK